MFQTTKQFIIISDLFPQTAPLFSTAVPHLRWQLLGQRLLFTFGRALLGEVKPMVMVPWRIWQWMCCQNINGLLPKIWRIWLRIWLRMSTMKGGHLVHAGDVP